MTFSFITLFPRIIEGYFQDSILKIAREKNLIHIQTIQPRDFATDAYKSVDFPQVGGGAGQVIGADIINSALAWLEKTSAESIAATNQAHAAKQENQTGQANQLSQTTKTTTPTQSQNPKLHIIFLTPSAPRFSQNDAIRLARKPHIIFVCGRYEGIDERAIEACADEVFCAGDFIMTGGELGALCLCDSIARQIPGVLGNSESLKGESFERDLLEAPIFARANASGEKFAKLSPPSEYSKGNHAKIATLKNSLALCKTRYFRPDLFGRHKAKNNL
ncbi:hypothetical protein BKN38_03535 [Helicobacter sp. CLO-3]|uniref:tRNA (guanosine(37)-N1)-methyltransferase TrmD n=1 Tax=unclassified Helicobacter TaxID=2593540 RepID=UPI000805BD92|nr:MULTISPECIES: tRNA (guanosine(37)-N1)-methyltransferase TrmD [unclassified Helicobacter]OBV28700.1 hypothetical protein BA723_08440 [Helicobacter sp. CLO-3]OHU84217.1 hypothetical protein BKN38_03535 [Helicobacter sp. CLO-3]